MVKFSYILNGVGWADSFLQIDDKTCYFSPSYLTEPLIDLVEGVLSLIYEIVPGDEVKQEVSFDWNFEPIGSNWSIRRVDRNTLRIIITTYQDIDNKSIGTPQIELDANCDFHLFLAELIHALELLLMKCGIVGYKSTWYHYDFPISSYLKLKYFYLHGKEFPEENTTEDGYIEYRKSNLIQELAMLMDITHLK
ncbi:hypothetical protein J31TS6_62170 [Brevibacillus reuszeri]|uniref:hypothetical protein n=1 Tax=Brevibacillus reuszeri TaxID=54915 RepID=UPI001AFDC832|nr:hypothetical protein [Brevibacillus reuszeri]GIO10189.1 hypothetical protein J31TS6_62170 [Brevibacillus reuszeri]